jgi:hypothetical protein
MLFNPVAKLFRGVGVEPGQGLAVGMHWRGRSAGLIPPLSLPPVAPWGHGTQDLASSFGSIRLSRNRLMVCVRLRSSARNGGKSQKDLGSPKVNGQ